MFTPQKYTLIWNYTIAKLGKTRSTDKIDSFSDKIDSGPAVGWDVNVNVNDNVNGNLFMVKKLKS